MIVGGVGAGMYGMLLIVILAIFVAGLMVGRTPEYVGKKIEAKEVKMAMLAILILPLMILGWTAVSLRSVRRPFASSRITGRTVSTKCSICTRRSTGNNGSAFAGFTGEHAVLQHHRRDRDVDRTVSS